MVYGMKVCGSKEHGIWRNEWSWHIIASERFKAATCLINFAVGG